MRKIRLRKISRHTLVQDILFDFVIKAGHKCFRCRKVLRRKDFTIDHKIPWLGDEKSSIVYFDLKNIAFSHLGCNVKARRIPNKLNRTMTEDRIVRAARKKAAWAALDKKVRQERRRLKYEKFGY